MFATLQTEGATRKRIRARWGHLLLFVHDDSELHSRIDGQGVRHVECVVQSWAALRIDFDADGGGLVDLARKEYRPLRRSQRLSVIGPLVPIHLRSTVRAAAGAAADAAA